MSVCLYVILLRIWMVGKSQKVLLDSRLVLAYTFAIRFWGYVNGHRLM